MRIKSTVSPFLALSLSLPLAVSAQATVSGAVFDSLRTFAPLVDASVVVTELNLYAFTDARGFFRFDALVPRGRYTVRFQHPTLDSLLVSPEPVTLVVGDSNAVSLALASPSIRSFVRMVCPRAAEATGVVVGRVRDASDSAGIAGATISTAWTEVQFAKTGMVRTNRVVIAKTITGGNYVLCGVPADIGTELIAVTDSVTSSPAEVFLKDVIVARRDFLLNRHPGATARITGIVRAVRGGPAVGAQVSAGGSATTRTDSYGRFAINGVPAGTQIVEARLLGSRPVSEAVNLFQGQTADVSLSFSQSVVALPTISVLGKAKNTGFFAEFNERLRQGQGYFLTPADVAKYQGYDLRQLLFRAGGLSPGKSSTQSFYTMRSTKGDRCIPDYFVDGVVWSGARNAIEDLNNAYRAENIRAVEVFAAMGTVPAIYDMKHGCGVVLIWTK